MVAAERTRFSLLLLLIVVLNVIARGHVVKRNVKTNESSSIDTNGSTQTACSASEGSSSSINITPKDSVISGAEPGNNLGQTGKIVRRMIEKVSLSGQLGGSYETITPRPRPGPVRDVAINTSVERQVTISWMKPELFPECVSSYRISYDDRSVTILGNETSVTIENLNSCKEYDFTIVTVDFAGKDAASIVVNGTVKEEKLSGVQDLELTEQDSRSLRACWKPPVNGTYCVAFYRYLAWATGDGNLPEQISNSTTDMDVSDVTLTFMEVFACTKYNVQVIPVSKGNNDGNNEIADIVTKERVILWYHIDPVRIKKQMPQSLELQTALTNDNNNNCYLHAVRFTCTTNNVPEGEDPKVMTGEAEIMDWNATCSAVVAPLQPYNEYNCTAAILNIAGWSDETALAPFMTGEDFPEQPHNLTLNGGARMIPPKVKNGIISRYRLHIRSKGAPYPTPSYCPLPDPYNTTIDLHEYDENAQWKNWSNDELTHKIDGLNPSTNYVVQVAAATKAGLGPYTEMVSVSTLPEQPEPVYGFSEYYVTPPEIDTPYNSTVHISWKIPCHLNGRLLSFTGQFIGYKGTFEHTFGWTRTIEPNEDILETNSLTQERLEPELKHNVLIMVFVRDAVKHSDAKFLVFQSPAGIPNITNEVNWGTVNVMDAPNPMKTARVTISDIIFKSNVGSITNVALLVSERHCQADPIPKRNISVEWPNVLSWKVASQMPCIPQYQTTPKLWNPVENGKLGGRQSSEIEYVIGEDHCEEDKEYCNGPLKPRTEYALILRIFTNSGYSDSAIQFFETDSWIRLTVLDWILVTLFIFLILVFVLGLVVLCRHRKNSIMLPSTSVTNQESNV